MNKDYSEIENNMLLYKSKETIVKDHIELLKRIDKAIELISKEFLCYDNESDEYIQGLKLLDILKEVE